MTGHSYEGVWKLLPELSFYQEGSAPDEGLYAISLDRDRVSLSVDWSKDGEKQSVRFSGLLDGQLHPTDIAPGGEVSFTHVDQDTLESLLVVDGVRMAFAQRRVSRDGTLMAVLQENAKPDGALVRVTQVYRRDT